MVMEYRDWPDRFGVELLHAALGGRRIVVADGGETPEDVVRDLVEARTSMSGLLSGLWGARIGALSAVTATEHDE